MTVMTRETDTYREQLDAVLRQPAGTALQAQRRAAFERFEALGFPTTRHEEWKYTDVSPMARTPFRPASASVVSADALHREYLGGLVACQAVFVNGRFSRELSTLDRLPRGVQVASLAEPMATQSEAVEHHLGQYAGSEDHAFVALNTALWSDGAYVHVARGAVVEEPIHLLFVTSEGSAPTVSHPRVLVVAEESSQATVVETYIGLAGVYWTNTVTEVVAGENAIVDHYKVELESTAAYHTAAMHVEMARSTSFTTHSLTLGGALVRNDVVARLGGEGAEAVLNGLYLVDGRRHADNHTVIDHAMPHCASHELYKGVMDGHSTGVFNGKIIVRPDAQKTDSKQTNQNLLLSNDAVVDTKPQLEIFADDVRCTHGATIGQLDEESVFYLRSRGIGLAEARSLLTYAFAGDIIRRIKVEPLRRHLETRLFGEMAAELVA